MIRLTTLGFALLLAVPAFADRDRGDHRAERRALIEESVRIQEERLKELTRIAESDGRLARELFDHAKYRDESATRLEQKARDFRAAADASGGEDRRRFAEFASELEAFAKHDHDFANERRRAAEIVQRQAEDARHGAEEHQRHLDHMREFLRGWR